MLNIYQIYCPSGSTWKHETAAETQVEGVNRPPSGSLVSLWQLGGILSNSTPFGSIACVCMLHLLPFALHLPICQMTKGRGKCRYTPKLRG